MDTAPLSTCGLRPPFVGPVGEYPMGVEPQLPVIDRATLTPLVRQARRSEAVEIVDWHTTPINFQGGGSTWRSVIARILPRTPPNTQRLTPVEPQLFQQVSQVADARIQT